MTTGLLKAEGTDLVAMVPASRLQPGPGRAERGPRALDACAMWAQEAPPTSGVAEGVA